MRAIILSLIFALLQKSGRSLDVLVLDDPSLSLDDDHKARFVDHLVGPLLSQGQVILATHYENFYKRAEPVFTNAQRLLMPPRRSEAAGVSFEPGDLLERVQRSLQEGSSCWREMAIDLRRWCERTLDTISGYCPQPFVMFNNIPDNVKAYAEITDPRVATGERDCIVRAFQSLEFCRARNWPAHDEEVTHTEVKDALATLRGCEEDVWAEIGRFKTLYRHDLLGRAVGARPTIQILSLKDRLEERELTVEGTAAAAHNGVGVSWGEHLTTQLGGLQGAIVTLDTISPIARIGQSLLLDSLDRHPQNGDLVVAETEDGARYTRRYWIDDDNNICLDAANPTDPYPPINPRAGTLGVRRIVGVLFHEIQTKRVGAVGTEWVPSNLGPRAFRGMLGVRVKGDCLKPLVRDQQIALLESLDHPAAPRDGDLVCIDIADTGAMLKRCHRQGSKWGLSAVNPNDVEAPIWVQAQDIRRCYRMTGVLFETTEEKAGPREQ